MRITGRHLRASNLQERRVLKGLGVDVIRVPLKLNPFAVARHVRKLAAGTGGNLPELRAMLATTLARAPVAASELPVIPVVPALPDSTSEPRREACAA
jgi:hypothetical protein